MKAILYNVCFKVCIVNQKYLRKNLDNSNTIEIKYDRCTTN